MDPQIDPIYIKQFKRGFAFGSNPVFYDCEDPTRIVPPVHDSAFMSGFKTGREAYIKYNGPICDGIPEKILNNQVISRFHVDGQLGYPLDMRGYTMHQQQFIIDAYYSGYLEYDDSAERELTAFLQLHNID